VCAYVRGGNSIVAGRYLEALAQVQSSNKLHQRFVQPTMGDPDPMNPPMKASTKCCETMLTFHMELHCFVGESLPLPSIQIIIPIPSQGLANIFVEAAIYVQNCASK